jgi:hypothetical protein
MGLKGDPWVSAMCNKIQFWPNHTLICIPYVTHESMGS